MFLEPKLEAHGESEEIDTDTADSVPTQEQEEQADNTFSRPQLALATLRRDFLPASSAA